MDLICLTCAKEASVVDLMQYCGNGWELEPLSESCMIGS